MRCRDHIALTLPSFLLRLTLGITFLWAGTAKIVGTTTTQGDNAARLANLAVPFIPITPEPTPEPAPEPEPTPPNEPTNPLPGSTDTPTDTPTNTLNPSESQNQPTTNPPTDPPTDLPSNPPVDPPIDPAASEAQSNPMSSQNYALRPIAQSTSPAVASDYPEPVTIKRVYGIALLLDHATKPSLDENSQPVSPTMPAWLGTGRTSIYAAWATTITELTAGFFLLIGLLTRFSALSLSIVMLVALWTTNIGPAALQSSDAILGFIPHTTDPWDPSAYSSLLWQLALIVMSLSVALLGAGPLSFDRMIFRPGRRDPYVSGESTPQKNKPQHQPQPQPTPEQQKDRSEFDRAPPPQSNPTP